jgi:hypothetical protein
LHHGFGGGRIARKERRNDLPMLGDRTVLSVCQEHCPMFVTQQGMV